MTELNALIAALREELQQYGELLARLDCQQEQVLQRAADEVLHTMAAIQQQGDVVLQARRERERCQRATAVSAGLNETCLFAELLPRLPADYRPLVGALVQENNALLLRVHQRSRQNHLLLSRTLEMMQRYLSACFPDAGPTLTYNELGTVRARRPVLTGRLEMVG